MLLSEVYNKNKKNLDRALQIQSLLENALEKGISLTDDIVNYTEDSNVLRSINFYESIFGNLSELKGSDMDPKALIGNCPNIPDIHMACGVDDFLFEKANDFYEFLKDKKVDATFVKAPGEHTWEFCDKYIKEFIKTLTL